MTRKVVTIENGRVALERYRAREIAAAEKYLADLDAAPNLYRDGSGQRADIIGLVVPETK